MKVVKPDIRLLFLCHDTSGPALMAAGFARARGPAGVQVAGAGMARGSTDPLVEEALREAGAALCVSDRRLLSELGTMEHDVVVTLCSEAARLCPCLPGNPVRVDWGLIDSVADQGDVHQRLEMLRVYRDTVSRLVDDLFDRGYLEALAAAKRGGDMILDNISDGIIAHDDQRRVFYFNRAAEAITGYRREDVLDRDCHEVFPGRFCGGRCHFCDGSAVTFDSLREEVRITTRSGERRLVDMSLRTMSHRGRDKVGMLISFRDLTRQRELARRLGEIESFSGIIGRDPKMLAVFDLIRDLADTDMPVLVQGESGTGKELVAAAIHNEGDRAHKLFVPVNCGALPENLLESELFGHVKGAFTGAIRDKKGRFELAHGGTIFLDEIGDVSPAMQVKLLRVLQEGRFERLGSERTTEVDVRVISATNKDLRSEMAQGTFREDLFYRLSVVPITLPPLRERRTDVPLLVEHILGRFLKERNREGVRASPEAVDALLSYDWPGNVRELQNWLQFALVKCKGDTLLPEHLPPVSGWRAPPRTKRPRSRKLDAASVRRALDQEGGNKVRAARVLGVSRATLYRFLDDSAS